MLGPADDIYRMLHGNMPHQLAPGGSAPPAPIGQMVGPPMPGLPGYGPAVPGGDAPGPIDSPHSWPGGMPPGFRAPSAGFPGGFRVRDAEDGIQFQGGAYSLRAPHRAAHEGPAGSFDEVVRFNCGSGSCRDTWESARATRSDDIVLSARRKLSEGSPELADSVVPVVPSTPDEVAAVRQAESSQRCYCSLERRIGRRVVRDATLKWWVRFLEPAAIALPFGPLGVGSDMKQPGYLAPAKYEKVEVPAPQGMRYSPPKTGTGIGFFVAALYKVDQYELFSEVSIQKFEETVESTWVICSPPPARCNSERELVEQRKITPGAKVGEPEVETRRSGVRLGLGYEAHRHSFVAGLEQELRYQKRMSEPPQVPPNWPFPQPLPIEPPLRHSSITNDLSRQVNPSAR